MVIAPAPRFARDHRGQILLHGHRFLLRAGLTLANVFAWLFVFEYFFSLSGSLSRASVGVLLMYGLSQGITVLLTPLSAAQLRRGTRRALVWATTLSASAFVVLGATLGGLFDEEPFAWGIALFAILLGAYRALYFAPYELTRAEAESTVPEDRIFYEILLALIPAFAGAALVMEAYAPLRLLFGAAALIGVSMLPLFALPSIRERFSFSYAQTFRELFSPRNRYSFWSSFFDGMQGAALFLIWPIAVFLIVGYSYATFGIIFTATLLTILLFRRASRRIWQRRELSTALMVVLASSGWIARLLAGGPVGVVLADSYAHTARPSRGTSLDPFAFEQAADNGSFIDEYTVLKELALALGRITLAGIVGLSLLVIPLVFAFAAALILAAFAAGISVVLARRSTLAPL